MRICGWMSDVCSSDLPREALDQVGHLSVVARQRRDLLRVVDDEHRPPQLGLCCLLVDLEHELARPVVVLDLDAVLTSDSPEVVEGHAHVDVHAGVLLDQLREGGSAPGRSEEHTSELQSLMRISYAVFCLKKKKHK